MTTLLFALARQFWKPLAIVVLLAALAIGAKLWLSAHDRAVLHGYVLLTEKQAADAQAGENKRQADAATSALKTLNERIAKDKAADASLDAAREKEIADYEAQLKAEKRRCDLNADDVRVIVHNGSAAALDSRHH